MVKLRDWLKNNKEKTKGITKEKFEKVKNKTKQKYNEVLDTEVEEIQDRTKQFVGQATETTKGYLTAILLILYFVFWLFVPTVFFIALFGIFSSSGDLSGSNDPVFWKSYYSPFLPAGIFSVIYIGVLSFIFIKIPEGMFKKAQKHGFKFSFVIFLLLLVIFFLVANNSYFKTW
tara:strand:- start:281 stop:802 length:522 start_codon:yes stop_codon:yes gene_type:complete